MLTLCSCFTYITERNLNLFYEMINNFMLSYLINNFMYSNLVSDGKPLIL